MMFLTQISGTVLQSLRLSDTGGIIMKATIISAVSTGLIAGVFGIISVLITNYFTNKNQLTDLKTNLSRDHADLSKEHTGLSKEHTGLSKEHAGLSKEHAALEKQLLAAQTRLDHLHDESIRMEGFRKDVEKQGVDVTAIKVGIDALAQKNGENIDRVRDLTRDLEKSEQALADTEKKLRDREWELAQSQRENQQLKQQIYNLQHPQQSWDEPER